MTHKNPAPRRVFTETQPARHAALPSKFPTCALPYRLFYALYLRGHVSEEESKIPIFEIESQKFDLSYVNELVNSVETELSVAHW